MKYCPVCQSTYDEAVSYCLHDGTALQPLANESVPRDDEVTWVKPKNQVVMLPLPPTEEITRPAVDVRETTGGGGLFWKILAAALAAVLLVVVSWAWRRDKTANNERPAPTVNSHEEAKLSPTQTPATPPTDRRPEENAVAEALQQWTGALRAHDLHGYMSHYAGKLEVYYKYRNWPLARVQADKAEAFARYYELDARISNLQVRLEPSGRRAVAEFIKSYSFKGDNKDFVGTTRSQLTFVRTDDGRWLIVGERDL